MSTPTCARVASLVGDADLVVALREVRIGAVLVLVALHTLFVLAGGAVWIGTVGVPDAPHALAVFVANRRGRAAVGVFEALDAPAARGVAEGLLRIVAIGVGPAQKASESRGTAERAVIARRSSPGR
jgi:hypothetical protein